MLYGVDPAPPADIAEFRKSHKFTLETDLDKALADPAVDGVILATPHELHEEQAMQVIAAGKNLFCEKPLTMTGDGARRIVDACRKAGKVLGIGHERRFEPAFEELQRLIDAGALGKLLLFEANVSHDQFRKLAADNWRLSSSSAPAGMMTAVGIHMTDLMVHFVGAGGGSSRPHGEPDLRAAGGGFRHRQHRLQVGRAGDLHLAVGDALLRPLHLLWRCRLGRDRQRSQCRPGQADHPHPLRRQRRGAA